MHHYSTSAADFAALWQRPGLAGDPAEIHAALLRAHAEPHRHYHTLEHVGACLRRLKDWQALAAQPDEIALALWFHDAIYKTHGSHNEERSAAWCTELLREGGAGPALARRIEQLILATRHAAVPEAGDAALLVDIDLAILGAPAPHYQRFEQQIRQEYAWVPAPQFAAGRTAILRGFLQRPRIYATEPAHAELEAVARVNLAAAIAALEP